MAVDPLDTACMVKIMVSQRQQRHDSTTKALPLTFKMTVESQKCYVYCRVVQSAAPGQAASDKPQEPAEGVDLGRRAVAKAKTEGAPLKGPSKNQIEPVEVIEATRSASEGLFLQFASPLSADSRCCYMQIQKGTDKDVVPMPQSSPAEISGAMSKVLSVASL